MSNKRRLEVAFTLVEMLVIAPFLILLIGGMIVLIVNLTGDVLLSRGRSTAIYNTQVALDSIENDIFTSNQFLATNNFTVPSPQGKDDSTAVFNNVTSGVPDTLILNTYTTNTNPLTPTKRPIFLDSPISCSNSYYSNPALMSNTVYFVSGGSLYRRVILPNPLPGYCNNNGTVWQIPSCSAGKVGTGNCKVSDIKLLDNVTGLTVSYFPQPSATTPDTDASSTANNAAARQAALNTDLTALVSLTVTSTVSGKDFTYTGTLRATHIN